MGIAAKQGSLMQRAHDKYGYDENGDDGDEIILPVVIIADSYGGYVCMICYSNLEQVDEFLTICANIILCRM